MKSLSLLLLTVGLVSAAAVPANKPVERSSALDFLDHAIRSLHVRDVLPIARAEAAAPDKREEAKKAEAVRRVVVRSAAANSTAPAGNATAPADDKNKDQNQDPNKDQNQDQNKGQNKGNDGKKGNKNKNGNGLPKKIQGVLAQLGIDGILDANKVAGIGLADQVSLLIQVQQLHIMAQLNIITRAQVVTVLNSAFASSGLKVAIVA